MSFDQEQHAVMLRQDVVYRSLAQSLARAHTFGEAKCSGVSCDRRNVCDRHLRPEADGQLWASFYAFGDGDCAAFVPAMDAAA